MADRKASTLEAYQLTASRFVKFALVGALGVLVNTALLLTLHGYLGLALIPASALAVEVAIIHNFFWNNHWTFGERGASLIRWAKFNLVSLVGLAITTGTLYALVDRLSIHYLVANLIGIGLATIWNFSLNSAWTWS